MARTSPKRTGPGKRAIGPKTRFAPDLLTLEDRSVPALIYVDAAFAGSTAGNSPNVDFNTGGTGPLGTVSKATMTFVATGNSAGVTGAGKFAVSDITTAFNAARDNKGADTILLAPGVFALDNSQGFSTKFGGFNDNTYFFNTDPLSILGSGNTSSIVQPTKATFSGTLDGTESDPVFAVRTGATFVGSDFRLDGAKIVLGGELLSLGRVKIVEVRLGHFFRTVFFRDFVHHGDWRLGQNADAGRDDFVLVFPQFIHRQKRFIFPADQHIADLALHEGVGGASGGGIQHWNMLIEFGDELLSFGLGRLHVVRLASLLELRQIAQFALERETPGGQIIPTSAAARFGIGGNHFHARLHQIPPVLDLLGIPRPVADDDHAVPSVARNLVIHQPPAPFGRLIEPFTRSAT